jgi:hypothetical protein
LGIAPKPAADLGIPKHGAVNGSPLDAAGSSANLNSSDGSWCKSVRKGNSMSAERKKTERKTSTKASPNSTAPVPTTRVPSQSKTLHPYEAVGFTRGLKWGSISVGSTAPIAKSSKPLAHKPELTTPEPSAN